mgnify:CR=1 FL=1
MWAGQAANAHPGIARWQRADAVPAALDLDAPAGPTLADEPQLHNAVHALVNAGTRRPRPTGGGDAAPRRVAGWAVLPARGAGWPRPEVDRAGGSPFLLPDTPRRGWGGGGGRMLGRTVRAAWRLANTWLGCAPRVVGWLTGRLVP